MPADHKVSVGWQIVALFVPIANFWAFYRIRKLRKYLLYVIAPSIATSTAATWYASEIIWAMNDAGFEFAEPTSPYDFVAWYQAPFLIANIIIWALFGFSIYLVVKWSREHNQKYETRPNTT